MNVWQMPYCLWLQYVDFAKAIRAEPDKFGW